MIKSRDSALLRRWYDDADALAFRDITRLYASMVFATSRRITGNVPDAEEVTQDCFVDLANANLHIEISLGGWLHTVATRRSLNRVRHEQRRVQRERNVSIARDDFDPTFRREMQAEVDRCIAALPEESRIPVIAYFLQERSQADIALELGVSQPTVSRRIERGVEEIRRGLRDRGAIASSAICMSVLSSEMAEAAPATVVQALGKIAIAGTTTVTPSVTSLPAITALGGFIVAKKIGIGVGLAVSIVLAAWFGSDTLRSVATRESPDSLGDEVQERSRTQAGILQSGAAVGEAPDGGSQNELPDSSASADSVSGASAEEPEFAKGVARVSSVGGFVMWQASKEPVSGQRVVLSSPSQRGLRDARSNSSGAFRFEDVEAGTYSIRVADEQLYPARKPLVFVVAEGENVQHLVLQLTTGAHVQGIVTVGNEPLPSTTVVIQETTWGRTTESGSRTVTTDAAGRFVLGNVLPGERIFKGRLQTATGRTLQSDDVRLSVIEGETSYLSLRFMGGTVSLEGIVFVNDEPAPDTTIHVQLADGSGRQNHGIFEVLTDVEGRYRVDNVEDALWSISATLTPEGSTTAVYSNFGQISVKPGDVAEFDFSFSVGNGVLEGAITRGGIPVRQGNIIIVGRVVSTDLKGRYRVENVSEGPTTIGVSLITENGKIISTASYDVEVTPGSVLQLDFDFPGGGGGIEGVVVTAEQVPIAATIVAVHTTDAGEEIHYFANANSEGHYVFSQIPEGPAILLLFVPDDEFVPLLSEAVSVEAGETLELDFEVAAHALPEN